MTSEAQLLDAAHHEAGHVVVAHANGVLEIAAELWPWPQYDQYRGRFSSRQWPKYVDQRAAIAIAGMLAEAKCGARRLDQSARFAQSGIEDLVTALRDPAERSHENPGEFAVAFITDSGNLEHAISGFSYSGSDKFDFVKYTTDRNAKVDPNSVVKRTMTILDERWAAVERVARKLAAQQLTGRRLDWDDIEPLIR